MPFLFHTSGLATVIQILRASSCAFLDANSGLLYPGFAFFCVDPEPTMAGDVKTVSCVSSGKNPAPNSSHRSAAVAVLQSSNMTQSMHIGLSLPR